MSLDENPDANAKYRAAGDLGERSGESRRILRERYDLMCALLPGLVRGQPDALARARKLILRIKHRPL